MGRIIEGKEINGSKRIKTKVCIIGTGCGGATLGAVLARAGVPVVLLEQGGHENPRTFDNFELNMAGRVSAERNMDTTADYGINLTYGSNVGGASVHYWADSYRTPVDRLHLFEKEYGIDGHGPKDLKHIWPQLDKALSVQSATDEYFNPMNQLVRKASQDLGWHGKRVPQARKNCQKSGHCMQGCFFDAKQSQLVTHIPEILKYGGKVYSDVRADRLVFKGDTITALEATVRDRRRNRDSRRKLTVQADTFVVAAGGFGSAAFLLKNDLKKKLPALGEFFSLNPSVFVHALYDQEITQWRNIPAAYGVEEFRLAKYKKGKYKGGGYMLMPNQLQPALLAAAIPGIGKDHRRWMEAMPNVGGTIGWLDDVPTELGRITVSVGDRKVHYPGGKLTELHIKDLLKRQAELNFAAGAKEVMIADLQGTLLKSMDDIKKIDQISVRPGQVMQAAPHPGGGCRMGKNPATSVVDSKHRVHGLKNLHVADSSVFPLGVSVDPSYTIMAYSHILAEQLLGG